MFFVNFQVTIQIFRWLFSSLSRIILREHVT
jgi:hypothetical protein